MTAVFLVDSRLVIVDRSDIDLIRAETGFQLSGEVSDESAQSIGKILGAQSILSGSLMELDGVYRFMVKVLNVETARVEALFPQDLLPDNRTAALLGTSPGLTTAQTPQRRNARQSAASVPQSENYPPELDRRLAELAALPAAADAAALIERRSAWAALLQYVETYYREHPEFAVAYDPSIVQEDIDYSRGTVTAKVAVQLAPLSGYRKAITAVIAALGKTGKSAEWGLANWPGSISFLGSGNMRSTYFINYEKIFDPQMTGPITGNTSADFIDKNITRRYRGTNFIGSTHDLESFGKVVTVRAALLNENSEIIALGEQHLRFAVAYRETWATGLGSSAPRPKNTITFSPMAIPEWFVFSGAKASDLSGAAFKIISVDNVVLDTQDSDYIRISTETINGG
jgi:hypothetical protein